MGFSPKDISAVESKGNGSSTSILYYVDDDEALSSQISQQTYGQSNNVSYNRLKFQQVLKKSGNKNPVKPTTAKLDAVAYDFRGSHEVRIYYVGDKNNNNAEANQLLELVNSNGGRGDWSDGALNDLNVMTGIASPVSANVSDGQGNLKVFFNNPKGVLCVAWVVLGETSWTHKVLDAKDGY